MTDKIRDIKASQPSLKGYQLYEALLFKNGRYFLFKLHIKRLMSSAAYFGVPLAREKAARSLKAFAGRLGRGSHKVRLVVDAAGHMKLTGKAIRRDGPPRPSKQGEPPAGGCLYENRIAVSRVVMDSNDIFLRHKTTRREVYDREYAKYLKKGCYDVIFFNDRGELTEAHSSNVFIKKNGIFYTPPVSCGLLPGTYRDYLLGKGGKYKEKVLHKKDLLNADAVYICNSVRGMRQVSL